MKIARVNRIKENGTLSFLVKLFLFLIILFLLDLTIGSILKYMYFKQDSGFLYRTTYAIDSTKADILIFGSSTANHHYYPDAFEKRMHLSFYNTGRDGNSIFYHYAILKGVLKRYSPKIAIFDFNRKDLMKDQQSYDRLSSLLPYYFNHPEMRSIIQLKSPYEKFKLLSKIYPFNSLIFSIIAGNSDFNRSRDGFEDKEGYVPLTKIWKNQVSTDTSFIKYKLDSTKILLFKSFISDCIKSNIKVYIFMSPEFIKYKFEDSSVLIGQEIARKFNIPFYDFSNDTTFLDNAGLFADQGHLNDSGAKIFSNKVIDTIFKEQLNIESNLIKLNKLPLNNNSITKKK